MKSRYMILLQCLIVSSLISVGVGQEEVDEPKELKLLREKFLTRVDLEMKPLRELYAKELQKLEDQLVRDRKLSEAVIVKNEKDNYRKAAGPSAPAVAVIPDSVDKAKSAMKSSVWLVYAAEDKKREQLLDTYHFVDEKNVYVFSSKKSFPWSVSSAKKASIAFISGDISISMDFKTHTATSVYQDKKYTIYLAGKVPKE